MAFRTQMVCIDLDNGLTFKEHRYLTCIWRVQILPNSHTQIFSEARHL